MQTPVPADDLGPITFEEYAIALLSLAFHDMTSRNLEHVRDASAWVFTKQDCSGGCVHDGHDFNCICCFLGLDPDKVARGIWRQLPHQDKVAVRAELILHCQK